LLSDFPKALEKTNEVFTFKDRPDEAENGFHYSKHKPYSLLKEKFSDRLEKFHRIINDLRLKSIADGDPQRYKYFNYSIISNIIWMHFIDCSQTVFIAMLEAIGPLLTHLIKHPESPIISDESLTSWSPSTGLPS
jgi:hypothetical protein